jgi:hypothetical protein
MHKAIKDEKGRYALRVDGAITFSEKSLTTPNEDGRYYGSFKFDDEDLPEVEKIFKGVIKDLSPLEDNFFFGDYPRWDEDEYGKFLRCSNRVDFILDVVDKEPIPLEDIRNYKYSLEIHLTRTKDGFIFMRIPRAVVCAENENYGVKVNDELFFDEDDDDSPF